MIKTYEFLQETLEFLYPSMTHILVGTKYPEKVDYDNYSFQKIRSDFWKEHPTLNVYDNWDDICRLRAVGVQDWQSLIWKFFDINQDLCFEFTYKYEDGGSTDYRVRYINGAMFVTGTTIISNGYRSTVWFYSGDDYGLVFWKSVNTLDWISSL